MNDAKIFIAGAHGFVGTNLLHVLKDKGCKNILSPSRKELNLLRQAETEKYLQTTKPEYVIIAAGKVGGIMANKNNPAAFLYENIAMWSNLIQTSFMHGVKKLIFMGSSTIYPKNALQPMKEEYLLEGKLEENVEPYALAKIFAIKLCKYYHVEFGCNFIPLTLSNLYGCHDHFDLETGHVVPVLIRKIHEAKAKQEPLIIWGTGKPSRDFLNAKDVAEAVFFCLKNINANNLFDMGIDHINVGSGIEVSIGDLCDIISRELDYKGRIEYDTTKPDGAMRKVLDISKIKSLGWAPSISLKQGIAETYQWFLKNQKSFD